MTVRLRRWRSRVSPRACTRAGTSPGPLSVLYCRLGSSVSACEAAADAMIGRRGGPELGVVGSTARGDEYRYSVNWSIVTKNGWDAVTPSRRLDGWRRIRTQRSPGYGRRRRGRSERWHLDGVRLRKGNGVMWVRLLKRLKRRRWSAAGASPRPVPAGSETRPTSDMAGVGHSFRDALNGDGLSVIAEIKRRSPSRGAMRLDADAASLARAYQHGGAACLSVLTDTPRFGGSSKDLIEARAAVDIPVLRKDFIHDALAVHDTHTMGADALLLIVADIGAERCQRLQQAALMLGIDVLTEVRTEEELEAALSHGAYMIAVNQRNDPKSHGSTVDYGKAVRMSRMFGQIDAGIVKVAASGIGIAGGTPLAAVADAGYDAALIGEALVTADDPVAMLRMLMRQAGLDA